MAAKQTLTQKVEALTSLVEAVVEAQASANATPEPKAPKQAKSKAEHASFAISDSDGNVVAHAKRYDGTKRSFVTVSTNLASDGTPRPSTKSGTGWYRSLSIEPEVLLAILDDSELRSLAESMVA